MERRNFLKSVAVAGASATVMQSCASAKKDESSVGELTGGTIVHTVYFWLKDGITEEEEKDFLNFFEALKKVPGIKSFHSGRPAPTTQRDVVDNSFHYSLLVTFANMDDINTYERHPDHLAAAGLYSKYWTKVAVRDTLLQ